MRTKQRKAIARANRRQQRANHLAKQKQDEEFDLEEELTEEDDVLDVESAAPEEGEEEVVEQKEKSYDEMDMYAGPTSWEEVDAAEAAREQAMAINEVTYQVGDMVRNILWHPMMEPKDKAEAIKKVGAGFEGRVNEAMAHHEEMKKDMDVLEIEAILAYDKRHASPTELVGDFITKALLTTGKRKKLSDEDFALPSKRKYPIHDKAHVRNALARAAQMMAQGGEAAADAKAAMPKIRAAAKRMGIEMSMDKEKSAVVVEKDASGQWRAVWWVSNNFIDWDGDIIAEDAHKEYVDWLEKNKDLAPVSLTWHTPGTARAHPMDFWAYENGFLIMSNPLEEQEAAALLKAKTIADIGVSHGTFVFARDAKDPRMITKYRMYEVSDLPLENAANPFTDFETIVKEVDMDKTKYLAAILGSEEKANAFMEKTGLKKKALEEAGIESKEKSEEKVETPATETKPEIKAEAPSQNEVVEAVLKAMDAQGLSETVAQIKEELEKVPVLEALVKELQGSQEEKLAEMLTPPAARFSWMQKQRASQKDETVLDTDKDKELKKSKPGVPDGYWLSEATGTTPVEAESLQ